MKLPSVWSSHQPVLLAVANVTSKPILELGAGMYSTIPLHNLLDGKNQKLVTVESNKAWLSKFRKLQCDWHSILWLPTIHLYPNLVQDWGLVFIDNTPFEARITVINHYKDKADYVILHDNDAITGEGMIGKTITPLDNKGKVIGVRTYDDVFKYWIEFFMEGWQGFHPPTLLGSNRINLDRVTSIDGMFIANRSKCIE